MRKMRTPSPSELRAAPLHPPSDRVGVPFTPRVPCASPSREVGLVTRTGGSVSSRTAALGPRELPTLPDLPKSRPALRPPRSGQRAPHRGWKRAL